VFDGIPTFADALLTMLAVFVAGTVLFAWGWFGGGDVKLLSACAGVVGSHHLLPFLLDVAIAGGLLALVEAARQRRLRTLFVSTAYAASGHRPAGALQLPYGIAIAAGALAYALPLLASPH
jgi:prepilin peptidase CpaA